MPRDISTVRKIAILRDQIERWRNTHYLATVNYEVGETLGDQQMMEAAKASLANAIQAIDLLNEKVAELSQDNLEEKHEER